MLGFIQGKLLSKSPETHQAVVLAGELGYEINLPQRMFDLLEVDRPVRLWIHSHIREDQFTLFGFESETEKYFFRQLLGVSGLGPKTALSLISEHGARRLVDLILQKNADQIAEAPGVGKKLAQRLVLELSTKVEKWAWVQALGPSEPAVAGETIRTHTDLRGDLLSALAHLGYQPRDIKNTLDKVFEDETAENAGFEYCLRSALKEMSGRPS